MIRQLAQCPYCQHCELALDDHPQLVFNPDGGPPQPCPHLAWVDGRYSQFERTPYGTNRVIGSTEFRWDSEGPDAAERLEPILPYLQELLQQGASWQFAPTEPFAIQALSAEEKATDRKGSYPVWDVDGWAIFAADPRAFWPALPTCQERLHASMKLGEGR